MLEDIRIENTSRLYKLGVHNKYGCLKLTIPLLKPLFTCNNMLVHVDIRHLDSVKKLDTDTRDTLTDTRLVQLFFKRHSYKLEAN